MRSTTIAAMIVCATVTFVTGCERSVTAPEHATDRAALFDAVWSQIDRDYPYFEYKHINWDSLGGYYRPLALDATSDADFARVLGGLMSELRDMHVSLTPFGPGSTIRYVSLSDTIDTHCDPSRTIARYVSQAGATPDGHIIYGTLATGVAYLRIPSFVADGWAGDIDRALEAVRGAKSLIIDVRDNMGGDHALAIAMAGRFASGRRTFGYLRYRNGSSHGEFTAYTRETVVRVGVRHFSGPVYLLTNRRVFSSAEEFVLAMRAQPNVTVVGDTTGGASGGPRAETLANGWTFQYSRWMEFTANGLVVEGVGLPPDVIVPATAADAKDGRDAALEKAIAMARATLQASR